MACSTAGSAVTAASLGRALQRTSDSHRLASTLLSCKRAVSTALLARISHIPQVRCSSRKVESVTGVPARFSAMKSQQSEEGAAAEAAAAAGAAALDDITPSLFDNIVSRQIPSTVVFENDKVLAFRDINPQAPVHVVVVPKARDGLTQLAKAEERHTEILGHLLYAAKEVARLEGLTNGYRVVINDGPDGCQSVYHLHLHVIGGRKLKWPPG